MLMIFFCSKKILRIWPILILFAGNCIVIILAVITLRQKHSSALILNICCLIILFIMLLMFSIHGPTNYTSAVGKFTSFENLISELQWFWNFLDLFFLDSYLLYAFIVFCVVFCISRCYSLHWQRTKILCLMDDGKKSDHFWYLTSITK